MASNVSRHDPVSTVQFDAEHLARNRKVALPTSLICRPRFARTMLGTPRLARLLGGCADDSELIAAFWPSSAPIGAGWEQDDDITAATRRAVGRRGARAGRAGAGRSLGS